MNYFAGGHLRYQRGAWRDDYGDPVEIEQVVHAHWEYVGADKRGRGGVFRCSAKGCYRPVKSKFCPDCGAHMDEEEWRMKVNAVRAMSGHRLFVRFNSGEFKIVDLTPYLDTPAFEPLKDEETFRGVYIDHGVPTWCYGDIDISPERLYNEGKEKT